MEIRKYEHACFVATINNQSIVVDPGELTTDFIDPRNVVAIVVTHMHPDHLSTTHVANILKSNPEAKFYAHQEVLDAANGIDGIAVKADDLIRTGDIPLHFNGGEHALIHPDIPMCANLGVMINDELYYPGDSFAEPDRHVKILALPIAAPWMKTAEGMDYLVKLRPERAFPTHDGVLSEAGRTFTDSWMKRAAEQAGTVYERL
jgi:L-ascorbate metabolism protein UlaG (beta-lactamase superfamily)